MGWWDLDNYTVITDSIQQWFIGQWEQKPDNRG